MDVEGEQEAIEDFHHPLTSAAPSLARSDGGVPELFDTDEPIAFDDDASARRWRVPCGDGGLLPGQAAVAG